MTDPTQTTHVVEAGGGGFGDVQLLMAPAWHHVQMLLLTDSLTYC